ncbi:hypothetical protein BACCIP111895_00041 [Neobacillus rhizosphaerae]|uniref:Uncharacterized protein n=1 Tax=Neobacillus rhizosphaerae TaxID=2880965 RepID=A0ABM9EJZ9_9BACI|nr:hypothetical protein BACCIP111895_00041 [Neobacillus rhizosphaerae]
MDSGCHTTVELTDDGVIFKRGKNDLMIHKAFVEKQKYNIAKFKKSNSKKLRLLQLVICNYPRLEVLW